MDKMDKIKILNFLKQKQKLIIEKDIKYIVTKGNENIAKGTSILYKVDHKYHGNEEYYTLFGICRVGKKTV